MGNRPGTVHKSQFEPASARERNLTLGGAKAWDRGITVPPRMASPLNVADNIRDLTSRLEKAESEARGALSLDRHNRWTEAAAYLRTELKAAEAHRDAQEQFVEASGATYAVPKPVGGAWGVALGMQLPADAEWRNNTPMADGLLYYFPNALAEVSRVSKVGNDQHNAGEPMHWARGKSTDHANKILKHLIDAGKFDTDGTRHTAKLAWRALALLQEEMERDTGAPPPRNAR